jgi:hypothetical protein
VAGACQLRRSSDNTASAEGWRRLVEETPHDRGAVAVFMTRQIAREVVERAERRNVDIEQGPSDRVAQAAGHPQRAVAQKRMEKDPDF